MSKRSQRQRTEITYGDACELLEEALAHGARPRILDALESSDDFPRACDRLRSAMRSHIFPTTGDPLRLHRIVQSFDTRLRRAGLHVLESWDYVAHRFADEITPVLMLDRCALDRVTDERRRGALAVLLDHYFLAVLGVIVARAWDDGDPNENLDRAGRLLVALQERNSSGRHFVADVETLLLMSVSHYHPEEHAYETVVQSFDVLRDGHRSRMAAACAAVLGGHLRWGMRFMYGRDVSRMRDDNIVDYPFVAYALLMLLRDYDELSACGATADERRPLAEAIVNAVSADPWFAVARTPEWLRILRDEHAEARDRLIANRDQLLDDFAPLQPTTREYSPLGFDCNFLCNTVVAMVATGLDDPGPHPPLNALFSRVSAWPDGAAERQANALMGYALRNRSPREAPLIVYDPREAAHVFNLTTSVLREVKGAPQPA